jgi:hypothetical protein
MLARSAAEQRFGQTRPAAGPISDEECTMAVADAACQERSEIDSVIDDAVITAADAWTRRDEQRLLELAQRQERALRAANELLGGEG